jgi:hypothetical protein
MTCIRKSIICRGSAFWLAAFVLLAFRSSCAQCRSTPQAAVESSLGRTPAGEFAGTPGTSFRVWRTEEDLTLGRQWVWVRACDAAGPALLTWVPLVRPLMRRQRSRESLSPAPVDPPVHSGDVVAVLESGGAISMHLSGNAIEAGELGEKIRVRINALQNGAVVVGTVSGKDEISLSN